MGCGNSQPEKQRSSEIDDQLKRERQNEQGEQKLLLLGAGESGKSTIFKQLKLIHCGGYTVKERASFRVIIHSNCIQRFGQFFCSCFWIIAFVLA